MANGSRGREYYTDAFYLGDIQKLVPLTINSSRGKALLVVHAGSGSISITVKDKNLATITTNGYAMTSPGDAAIIALGPTSVGRLDFNGALATGVVKVYELY